MLPKIIYITWLMIIVSDFVYGNYNDYDYEVKNRSGILKDLKKMEDLFLIDSDNINQDIFKKEIIHDFSLSLEICQHSLDVAARKVAFLLDVISPDEFSEVKEIVETSENEINEELDNEDDENLEFNILVEDFSDVENIKRKEKEHQKKIYFEDLENLLKTFNHACSSLPTILPTISNRRTRSPQQIAKRLALSLKKWGEKWLGRVEQNLDAFLVNCLKAEECENYLEIAFKQLVKILKAYNYDIDKDTLSIFKEIRHSPYKSSPSIESLNEMQKVALIMGDSLDPFKENDDAYYIAEAVNGIEDTLENIKGLNTIGLISNLFRYKSFENSKNAAIIEIEENKIVTKISTTFLSVALGSSIIQEKWIEIRHQKEKFTKIASALSPSFLRVGGSAANFLTYDPSSIEEDKSGNIFNNIISYKGNHPKAKPAYQKHLNSNNIVQNLIPKRASHPKKGTRNQYMIETNRINSFKLFEEQFDFDDNCTSQLMVEKDYKNYTMTEKDWKFLVELVRDLKWDLVFDLNQFWRDPQGHWDPTNAKLIINDPQSSTVPIIWQLGNEPNSYHHKFNWSIAPEEAAEDYRILSELVSGDHSKIVVIGPDVTRPKHLEGELQEDSMKFLRRFLKDGEKYIDALTWHQYYVDGKTATLENFLSAEILNSFPMELDQIVATRDQFAPGKPIWITETATAWRGGAPGLSNRFVGCFSWLDKLGAAALGGASLVFRQTLYGGCYALLDSQLQPYPDFWVSVLHKRLVGEIVLLPRVRLANNSTRIYAHCLNPTHHMFQKGAIVIFGLNLSGEPESLTIIGKQLKMSSKFLYEFSAPQGDLQSRDILLNGNILKLSDDGSLPEFVAVEVKSEDLKMTRYSLNFWVFPDADIEVC